jgi:hypothetical protein
MMIDTDTEMRIAELERERDRIAEYDKLYASQIVGLAEELHENETDKLKKMFLGDIIRLAKLIEKDK